MTVDTRISARRGWYPDPLRPGVSRFWDGRGWADGSDGAPPVRASREIFVRELGRSLRAWVRYDVPDWLRNAGRPDNGRPDMRRARRLTVWGWITLLLSPVWWGLVVVAGVIATISGMDNGSVPVVSGTVSLVLVVIVAALPTAVGAQLLVAAHRARHPRR